MTATLLYRIDPAKRMHRFYRLDVRANLFGQWCLMREWDCIGTTGRERSVPFPTQHEAHVALDKQRRAKERRGYVHNS
jgi:predicted DNA-binding WGR domain protein